MSKESLEGLRMETLMIHAGHSADPATRALAAPIYQTATFGFDTVDEMDSSWDRTGLVYCREGNPTVYALQDKLAAMEGGEAALCASSGMGAICSTLLTVLRRGDHLLCSEEVFSHSGVFVKELLCDKMGIDVSYADFRDVENVMQNIRSNTAVLFTETPSNPSLGVVNIEAIGRVAKENDCLLIVDSTFAPPPIQRPLSLGADMVVHSLTKYINGHGDVIAGFIIGKADFIGQCRMFGLKDMTGAVMSPFNAFLIARGLKTLDIRMERHCANAKALADFFVHHPAVKEVYYPGLENFQGHEIAKKQMSDFGGMMSIELNASRDAVAAALNKLQMVTIAVSLGDAETLVEHPASMTHSTYSPEELAAAGISEGLVRISAGLENVEDIIADFKAILDTLI